MIRRFAPMIVGIASLAAQGSAPAPGTSAPPSGDSAAPSIGPALVPYASLGSLVAQQMRIAELGWTEAQLNAFLVGVRASYEGRGFPANEETKRLTEEIDQRLAGGKPSATNSPPTATPAAPASSSAAIETFMRDARATFGLQQSDTGLLFKVLAAGSGPRPRRADTVVVNISATAPDHKTALPQLSGDKVRVRVADLLPGLTEGIQMMGLGGRMLLVLPPSLSFDIGEWPSGIERGAPLFFELTLIDVVTNESAPP